jgi:hypothetical protein
MDSINNIEITNEKGDIPSPYPLPNPLQPLKMTLLYKDMFNQYITKIIELKKYSENDTLKDISKKINVAYRRSDTKHPTTCNYMFLYEGKQLSTNVPLKKLLLMKNLNFNRNDPIIVLQKQPIKYPIDIMTSMLELFSDLGNTINDNGDNNEREDYNDSDSDDNNNNNESGMGEHVQETEISANEDVNTSINGENFQENMITLTNMGFTNEDAMCALVSSGGSLDLAVTILIPS